MRPAALAACKHLRLALSKDICDIMDVRFPKRPKKQTYFLDYISLNKLKMPNTETYIIHISAESRTGSGTLRILICINYWQKSFEQHEIVSVLVP